MLNMSVPVRTLKFTPPAKPSLLERAAEALVANPSASLAEVAQAAGIGRTTLHKQYATRQDLLVAVAHESLDQLERAVAGAGDDLHRLVSALIPLGARLAFLFRQPSLDAEPEVMERLAALDAPILRLVRDAQRSGGLRADLPDWWFVSTLYAQVYVAWEAVVCGRLAPLTAPDLVMTTLLSGLGGGWSGGPVGEGGSSDRPGGRKSESDEGSPEQTGSDEGSLEQTGFAEGTPHPFGPETRPDQKTRSDPEHGPGPQEGPGPENGKGRTR